MPRLKSKMANSAEAVHNATFVTNRRATENNYPYPIAIEL